MRASRRATTRRITTTLAIACGTAYLAAGAGAREPTTEDATVVGDPGAEFSALSPGPGTPRLVRTELAGAEPGRAERRRSRVYFAALDEIHYTDEESPGRVEYLDVSGSPLTAAWFPEEALRAFETDRVIAAVNRFERSPLAGAGGERARLGLALVTGDNADNQQRNELVAVRTLLEGGRLDPNSGVEAGGPCPSGSIPAGEAARYTGYQDYDDYLETDGFYDPDKPVGRWSAWPRYPGLMDRAQLPFQAAGLDVPSYVALGNHDRLQQGNQWVNAGFEAVATGCAKVFAPLGTSVVEPGAILSSPQSFGAVPPDPERRSLSYPELRELYQAGAQEDGHGLGLVDAAELKASDGAAAYYSFSPLPGIRVIGLNTVSEGGITGPSAGGNLDDPQFRWLEAELAAAERRGEYAIVFGHHPIPSLSSDVPDETAPPCTGATPEPNPGCDLDPRSSQPVHTGADFTELLLESRAVIAYVAGDSTLNRVTPYARAGGGGFWQIESGAAGQWPSQARLLELMDNRDGTLSLFATMIDQQAPAELPAPETPAGRLGVAELASIGRAFSFNDPQRDPVAMSGGPPDRNVELLLRQPFGRGAGPGRCANPVRGTAAGERLRGSAGGDRIDGRGGRDRIGAGGGPDCVRGGAGGDRIGGGAGGDRIAGGRGADRLKPGGGRDRVVGGLGPDLVKARGGGADRVRCGAGSDRAILGDGDRARGCEKLR